MKCDFSLINLRGIFIDQDKFAEVDHHGNIVKVGQSETVECSAEERLQMGLQARQHPGSQLQTR